MPGDPCECRMHAARCAALAATARTPQLRAMFLDLSKSWEKLAIQLEDAVAKITESEAIRSQVQESLNVTTRLSSLPIWNKIGLD
jgi:hypothetical protein